MDNVSRHISFQSPYADDRIKCRTLYSH